MMLLSTNSTIEELIVEHLKNGPITTIALIQAIQKLQPTTTKQGIYKALKKLNKEKIIIKNKQQLSLDIYWLKKVHRYVSTAMLNIQTRLSAADYFVHLREGDKIQLYFKTAEELNRFVINLDLAFMEMLPQQKYDYIYNPHQIYIYKSTQEEREVIETYTDGDRYIFIVIGNKTAFDESVVNALQHNNIQFYFPEKPLFPRDNYHVGVNGDYIFETFHSKEVETALQQFYQTHTTLSETAIADLHTIMQIPSRNKLVLSRDRKKATKLRKKIGKYFYIP